MKNFVSCDLTEKKIFARAAFSSDFRFRWQDLPKIVFFSSNPIFKSSNQFVTTVNLTAKNNTWDFMQVKCGSYLQTYAITEKMRAKVLLLMQSVSAEMLEKVSCLAFFSGDACLSLKFGNQIPLVVRFNYCSRQYQSRYLSCLCNYVTCKIDRNNRTVQI